MNNSSTTSNNNNNNNNNGANGQQYEARILSTDTNPVPQQQQQHEPPGPRRRSSSIVMIHTPSVVERSGSNRIAPPPPPPQPSLPSSFPPNAAASFSSDPMRDVMWNFRTLHRSRRSIVDVRAPAEMSGEHFFSSSSSSSFYNDSEGRQSTDYGSVSNCSSRSGGGGGGGGGCGSSNYENSRDVEDRGETELIPTTATATATTTTTDNDKAIMGGGVRMATGGDVGRNTITTTATTTIATGGQQYVKKIKHVHRHEHHHHHKKHHHHHHKKTKTWYQHVVSQMPAVVLMGIFHLMIGIPFGVSYFPVGWSAQGGGGGRGRDTGEVGEDVSNGVFPLPGKEALGIRMFLFSTMIGQIAFTFASKFNNCIGLQMVENVPFCHSLAYIVIREQGYGMESLSTLFFLFGFSSVIVGVVFYLLGRLEMGRVVYFFPTHVLVGCIGGIGVFIVKTGLEVAANITFPFDLEGIKRLMEEFNLLYVVFLFEITLRLLTRLTSDAHGKSRYPLLPPIFFCMITPIFYLVLLILRVDMKDVEDAGYFFPPLDACDPEVTDDDCGNQSVLSSIFNENLWDIWRLIDLSTVSWTAVINSVPTMVALVSFSLIHVPINIPAFAISTDVEADMNAELMAHGYSNGFAGIFGGLQNYMAYSNSVLYAKSGGFGKGSSIAIAFITAILFFVGPTIASYIPRCMAGTLLLHIGIDLFLEGVYDSYGKFDNLEYSGIWLITIVMTVYGMEAALIAGIIAALSTYAFQSITYMNPIKRTMSAEHLRSSSWNRCAEANAILDDDEIGRKRIFIIQLQGHLFFGNVAQLTDKIKKLLKQKHGTSEEPWIVIIDFTLVLGLDSSAAQSITKLKNSMHKSFHVEHCIFVTGSDAGFPCEYELSRELSTPSMHAASFSDERNGHRASITDNNGDRANVDGEATALLQMPRRRTAEGRGSVSSVRGSHHLEPFYTLPHLPEDHVCGSLDAALIFSEDVLVARQDPTLLNDELGVCVSFTRSSIRDACSPEEDWDLALRYLTNLCPGQDPEDVKELFFLFEREIFLEDEILWTQGSSSDCAKLLVRGKLLSVLENEEETTEMVKNGSMLGELGLVLGCDRMSTVRCVSEEAVLYSISRDSWERLVTSNPRIARFLDLIVVRYLAHRVQHVSNRIFETRCLPI